MNLEIKIEKRYTESCGSTRATVEDDGNDFILAICTPLMKSVRKDLKSSDTVMFIDSSSMYGIHNCRVFLLLSESVAGGLPLGIVLTMSEKEIVICTGISLIKTISC